MKGLSREQVGELVILSETLLFSIFPVIIVLTYTTLSGLVSLAWSTLFASVFFACVIAYKGLWREMLNVQLWKYSLLIAFFIGVLFYGLFFIGLEYTTPGNASIICLFQVFTSFLFFNVYRKEYISLAHKVGAVLMVVGALIILGDGWSGINVGDLLIFAGAFFTPIGNYFQQRAREIASSESIVFLRSALSVLILFPLMYGLKASASFADIQASLVFLVVNGVLLLGLTKVLWIEGIHRISVTKATALSSIAPLLTLFFAWIVLNQAPTVWQLLSLAPFILGALLLTGHMKLWKA